MTLELLMEEKVIVTVLLGFTIFFLLLVSGIFEGGHEPIKPPNIPPPPPPSRPHPLLFRRRLRVRTKNEEDMFYEAKQGTKTYEYIKGILDAEKRERQAYMERVKEAVGFEFDDYLCCLANDSNDRKIEISYIWVSFKQYETLDNKAWRVMNWDKREDGRYVAIVPNKRYKQGRLLASVLDSYKSLIGKDEIIKELGIDVSHVGPFGNKIMLFRRKDCIFVSFDDRARVEECNLDFKKVEIEGY